MDYLNENFFIIIFLSIKWMWEEWMDGWMDGLYRKIRVEESRSYEIELNRKMMKEQQEEDGT